MPTTARSRVLAVLLAAVVLIGGANLAAYAANGKPLLLGKSNVETKKAVVKNTGSGPALHLKTQPGQAPLKVNRTKKVNNLNADLVDGHNAADLESVGYRYNVPSTGDDAFQQIAFPGLPPGRYLMSYSIVSKDGGDVYCVMSGSRQALSYSSERGGAFDTNNASAMVDLTGGPDTLSCSGEATMELYSVAGDAVSEVSFTRLDSFTTRAPTVTRPSAPRGRGAATAR